MAITDANTRRGLVARLIGFGSSPAEAGPRAPLGPTVALTISLAVACFVVALGVVELTSTPHRLPPPYGSENQPAESALYAIGFAVILPLAVIAVPRIADAIAASPNGAGVSFLSALLAATLTGSILVTRALPGGGGVAKALAVAAVWLAWAGALLARAARPRPFGPLLRVARLSTPMWALTGALVLGSLLIFTALESMSLVAVAIGAVVALAVLVLYARRRDRARRMPRPWGLGIDAGAILLILLAIPDLDLFKPEATANRYLRLFKTAVVQYHQDYVLGPVNEVLHGGAVLVHTASQYGIASLYFLAGWFQIAPIGYGTLGFLDGVLFALFFAAAYGVLRLAGARRPLAAGALAVAVIALIYNLLYSVGSLPAQHGPLRFGLPMGVVVGAVVEARWPSRARAGRAAQLVFLGLASVWALEALAATALTYGAIVVFQAWARPGPGRLGWLGRRAGVAVAACVAAHLTLVALTVAFAGELPDYGWYLAFLHAFVVGNVGDFTYDFAHWSPGLVVGVAYAASAAAFAVLVRRRRDLVEREWTALVAICGTTAYGIALFSYFVDRSAPHVLPYVSLPLVMAATLWLSLLMRGALGPSRLARTAGLAVGLTVSVLLVSVAWSSIGERFPRTALAHVLPGGESARAALHRLWHLPALNARTPQGESLLGRFMPGERRVLVLLPSDLETEILIRTGRANALPISYPIEDSFAPGQYLPGLRRTVAKLRPGERLLTDAAGVRLFAAFRARPSHDPLSDPRVDVSLAPLQAWVLQAIGQRFDLRVVHRDPQGLAVAELARRR